MFTSSLRKKIKNVSLVKKIFQERWLKRAEVFPSQVIIEVTSLCNSRCIHCEYPKLQRPHAPMDMALFRKIIDECARFKKYCRIVDLYWMGEPLLDPAFFEKARYAKQKNSFLVSINSNGSLLTPKNCQRLIDSKIDQIIFGVDGATRESYEKVRVGLSYEKMVEGIKRLAALKKKLKVTAPRIKVRMTLTPFNANEIDLFKKTWEGIADKSVVRQMHVWGGDTIDEKLIRHSYQKVNYQGNKSTPCFYPWTTMVIAQDGRVALCCVDARVQEVVGNLNKETMFDIWHGEKLKSVREKHLAGRLSEVPLCQKCNFRETKGHPWWWQN